MRYWPCMSWLLHAGMERWACLGSNQRDRGAVAALPRGAGAAHQGAHEAWRASSAIPHILAQGIAPPFLHATPPNPSVPCSKGLVEIWEKLLFNLHVDHRWKDLLAVIFV